MLKVDIIKENSDDRIVKIIIFNLKKKITKTSFSIQIRYLHKGAPKLYNEFMNQFFTSI